MTATYTSKLAEFSVRTRFADLPPSAVEATKDLIIDTLGCAVSGFGFASGEIISQVIGGVGGAPEATELVTGRRLPAAAAAYINSHAANVLDAEETFQFHHHAATTVLSALAVAEQQGSTGEEFLTAVAVGFDVGARLAMSLKWGAVNTADPDQPDLAELHSMSWSTVTAAVVTGRLLGLTVEQMVHAFGICGATMPVPASHTMQALVRQPLPMTKYTMYGTCSQLGVQAAQLAAAGFTAPEGILDGPRGLWRVLGAIRSDWDELDQQLGERWWVEWTSYKLYPSCRFSSTAIDLAVELRDRHDLQVDDITGVEVAVHERAIINGLDRTEVTNPVEGGFSIPFLISTALHGVTPGPQWHTEATRTDSSISRLKEMVNVVPLPEAAEAVAEQVRETGWYQRVPYRMRIEAAGSTYTAAAEYSMGDPWTEATRVGRERLVAKFRDFAADTLSSARIDRAVEIAATIEKEPDVTQLVQTLVRETAPAGAR